MINLFHILCSVRKCNLMYLKFKILGNIHTTKVIKFVFKFEEVLQKSLLLIVYYLKKYFELLDFYTTLREANQKINWFRLLLH